MMSVPSLGLIAIAEIPPPSRDGIARRARPVSASNTITWPDWNTLNTIRGAARGASSFA